MITAKTEGFRYEVDKADPDYINNWYVKHDFMCSDPSDSKTVRWYFVGFTFGFVLFFLPDYLGRKKCMTLLLVPLAAAQYIIVFSPVL